MARKLALAVLALMAFATATCAQESAPRHPCDPACQVLDLTEITPTSFHETIWKMMEQCSGRSADFSAIRWYIAKAIIPAQHVAGRRIAGLYSEGRILFDREYAFDGTTVSHEILHALFGGPVPMDVANSCVLRWQVLAPRR